VTGAAGTLAGALLRGAGFWVCANKGADNAAIKAHDARTRAQSILVVLESGISFFFE